MRALALICLAALAGCATAPRPNACQLRRQDPVLVLEDRVAALEKYVKELNDLSAESFLDHEGRLRLIEAKKKRGDQ